MVALVFLLLLSCSKEEEKIEGAEIQTTTVVEKISELDLGYQNLEEGKKHNELLDIILTNWSIDQNDEASIVKEIKRILKEHTEEFAIANNFEYEEFIKNVDFDIESMRVVDNMSIDHLKKIGYSARLAQKTVQFYNEFISLNGTENVAELQEAFLSHYQENVSDLSKDDQIYFGMMIDIAVHSTYFWYPKERGGMNKLAEFSGDTSQIYAKANIWPGWGRVFLADCIGAVTGGVSSVISSGGATAIPNPGLGGLPTASAVAIITGAGASAGKAI